MILGINKIQNQDTKIESISTEWFASLVIDKFQLENDFRDIFTELEEVSRLHDNVNHIANVYAKYASTEALNVINTLVDNQINAASVEGVMANIGNKIVSVLKKLWEWIKRFFTWFFNGLKRLFGFGKVKATANSKLGKAAKKNSKVAKVVEIVNDKKDVPPEQKISPATAKVLIEEKVIVKPIKTKVIENLDAFVVGTDKKAAELEQVVKEVTTDSANIDKAQKLLDSSTVPQPKIVEKEVSPDKFVQLVHQYKSAFTRISKSDVAIANCYGKITQACEKSQNNSSSNQNNNAPKIAEALRNTAAQCAKADKNFLGHASTIRPSINHDITSDESSSNPLDKLFAEAEKRPRPQQEPYHKKRKPLEPELLELA